MIFGSINYLKKPLKGLSNETVITKKWIHASHKLSGEVKVKVRMEQRVREFSQPNHFQFSSLSSSIKESLLDFKQRFHLNDFRQFSLLKIEMNQHSQKRVNFLGTVNKLITLNVALISPQNRNSKNLKT